MEEFFLLLWPQFDTNWFLAINGSYNSVLDAIMWFFSNKYVWIPLYVAVAYFFYRKMGVKGLVAIAFALICFALTDLISAEVIKPAFQRLRPSRDPSMEELVHLLEGKGCRYGFVSNHAANTFGFTLFSFLVFKLRRLFYLVFLWPTLVSYSRVYVGKHYPLDVLAGAVVGLLLAGLCFWLFVKCWKYLKDKWKLREGPIDKKTA